MCGNCGNQSLWRCCSGRGVAVRTAAIPGVTVAFFFFSVDALGNAGVPHRKGFICMYIYIHICIHFDDLLL